MLRHHFSERISAGLSIPTGFVRFDAGGTSLVQRAAGFGDVEVLGRYVLRKGSGFGINLELESSLLLPTGESNLATAQPDAEAPPNILSLGRGAFAASSRLAARKFVARDWIARAWVGAAAPFSANANNIRFGSLFHGGLGGTYLAGDTWIFGSQVSASALTRSRSSINGELLNSGGFWLHADVTAGMRISDDLNVALTARAPVYLDVQGTQITETFTVLAQMTMQFGAEDEEEHEHEHEHGDAHEHGDKHEHDDAHEHGDEHEARAPTPGHAADIADSARGGQSFDAQAIAVPGKITVVDFWARWCGPCKPLTEGLEALAAKYPDVAIRKVEVPTFDAPVTNEHLADAEGLPIVWIYDRQGKRVHVLVQKQLAEVSEHIETLRAVAP